MHWELPIRPVVAEAPLRLPINVLLALPEYVTSNPNVPLFNLPGAVSSLLGDWQRAVNVMNPKVWAPGWDSENFLNFVFHAQPRPSSFPESAVEGLRASGLPGLLGTVEDEPQKISKYAVVHFVGKFHFDTASEDHFLDLGEGHLVGAGILRDALVSCRTRLLILQSLEVNNFPGMASQRLAEYIVGGGGPAVLIVDGSDTEILNAFFFKLYANILQNRPLESAVRDGYDAALRIWLVYGKGGNDLLRFDAWMEELTKQLDDYSGLVSKRLEAMRRLTRSLHRDQIRARSRVLDDSIISLEDFGSRVDLASSMLRRVKVTPWEREGEGPILLLSEIAEEVARIAYDAEPTEGVGLQPWLERRLLAEAQLAPRVLNANFANPETHLVLQTRDGLVAGRTYDLLVDVGPRWNKLPSIVVGHADFPEFALPPDKDGYLVQVVVVSDVFSPRLASAEIWVPRRTGRSFPYEHGERAGQPGPVALRLRAPEFSADSDASVLSARARLCLYYENNLLQSALVKAGVIRSAGVVLNEDNAVEVDFVLSGSFQEIDRFARRNVKLSSEEGAGYPVALNLALNDDGAGGHRIIVKNHPKLTVWRPYDADAAKDDLAEAREKLWDCFWQKDKKTCKVQKGKNGLDANNGKPLRQFKCDLYRLALLGDSLYNKAFDQVNLDGTGKDWRTWEWELREALAATSVIQVARTGPAQYVYPWALLYDIPLPDKNVPDQLRFCEVLKEWSDPEGIRDKPPKESCPYKDDPAHQKNTLCPYAFWGLKHYIEQPINRQPNPKGANGSHELSQNAPDGIHVGAVLDLAVAVTRDSRLDLKLITNHLSKIKSIVAFTPDNGADDWVKVSAMLQSPEIVYFLCHGEYDPERKEPYLGVGQWDNNHIHRVYPNELIGWARTQNPKLWQDRRPLIFINGCHTSNLKPGEILNFVSTFANLGASGVIGTEVSVQLPLATKLAETLLSTIASGVPVGEAMRQLRWELANKGNLLGLAYTPYCLADLHVVRI